jgi:hypothetical protein
MRFHLKASVALSVKSLYRLAGCSVLSVGPCRLAFAQGAKRIEQFAPELDSIIGIGESNNLPMASAATVGRPRVRCGGKTAATYCSVTSMATGA